MNRRERRAARKGSVKTGQSKADQLFASAVAAHREGKVREAARAYARILAKLPNHADALQMSGVAALQMEDFPNAVDKFQRSIVAAPAPVAEFHGNLGEAYRQMGEIDRARSEFGQAIELNPQYVDAYFNLGLAELSVGSFAEAKRNLSEVLVLAPEAADVRFPLAEAMVGLGLNSEAIDEYELALKYDPENVMGLSNLANLYKHLGQHSKSLELYRRAATIRPQAAEFHVNIGIALEEQGELVDALSAFQTAVTQDPRRAEWRIYEASLLHQLGRLEEAQAAYSKATDLDPGNIAAEWGAALMLPIIYETEEEVEFYRQSWRQGLDRLDRVIELKSEQQITDAFDVLCGTPNFLLHYQGHDVRDDQARYGKLVHRIVNAKLPKYAALDPERYELQSESRIRVGFVSSFFYHHSIGKLMGPWASIMDSDRFEVFVWHLGVPVDAMTETIRENVEHFYHVPKFSESLVEMIADAGLDALIFTDIGMDPIAQVLGGLRLATAQCNCLGHPVPSGLPNMDYVFSSELMEPEDAATHYTEKLQLLPNLQFYHDMDRIKRDMPSPMERTSNEIRYLCSQSLFKLQPQYDMVFARIAKRVPDAKIWFIQHRSHVVNEIFERRMDTAFRAEGLDFKEHIVWQPRQNASGFLKLNQDADILLDSFLWSGNVSTLEGIACGLPVVTCPGSHFRSRHTYGILKLLEVDQLIAETPQEYVDLAVRLATDEIWRNEVVEKLQQNMHRAYNDTEPLDAIENFLERVCR